MNWERLAYCGIYPGIGIARVGASDSEWFLAPEVPNVPPKPEAGGYKDEKGRLKRQGARFRIYGFDEQGKVLGEITADMAEIEWRVHLANVKAGWYKFENAMDLGRLAKSATRRNANIVGSERERLVINPGGRKIAGKNISGTAYRFDNGKFFNRPVYLGELLTDELGRLVVLGGHGVSESATGAAPTTFANNEGWHDDVSDGPVFATVKINDICFEAKPAWVAVTPPNYAPDTWGIVTMYDTLLPVFHKAFNYPVPERIEFWQHIYPIFERLNYLSGLNVGGYILFGPGSPLDLSNEKYIERLSDPAKTNEEFRKQVFDLFRDPASTQTDKSALPPYYGDAFGEDNDDPKFGLALTPIQYEWMRKWSEGEFTSEKSSLKIWHTLDEVPLHEQPDCLNRAHLESILGGPFHPGIELTWTLRLPSMWSEPFRLRTLPEGQMPCLDYGETLSPDSALNKYGPFNSSGPGMLTAFLGVPWQTDHASCDAGYRTGLHLPLPSYWAPRAPNQVLSESSYIALKNESISELQRMKYLSYRSQWYRLLRPNYSDRIKDMVQYWDELGVVVQKSSPDYFKKLDLPAHLLVETELERSISSPANREDDETWRMLQRIERGEKPLHPMTPVKTLRRYLGRDEK